MNNGVKMVYKTREEKINEFADTDKGEFDDIGDLDIKIHPQYYIHINLLNISRCFSEGSVDQNILKYTIYINTIENICKSSRLLDRDYEKELKDLGSIGDNTKDQLNYFTKKLGLLMNRIFESRMITEPMTTKETNQEVVLHD